MKKKLTGLLCIAVILSMMSGCNKKASSQQTEAETEAAAEKTTEDEAEEETETKTEKDSEDKEKRSAEELFDVEDSDDSTEIKFGTNQNDAVLMPMGTKLYGTMSSGYYWFSFTTGSNANPDYRMTMINKAAKSDYITAKVFDKYGEEAASGSADSDGTASTFSLGGLKSGTKYYVQLTSNLNREAEAMVIIRDLNEASSGVKTTDSLPVIGNTVVLATNQDDAGLIPVGSTVKAKTEGGYYYYAFYAEYSGEYSITVVDETAESDYVTAKLFDEYGTEMVSGSADNSGTASTFSLGELTAGTVYYIQITSNLNREADYTFFIHEPVDVPDRTAVIEDGGSDGNSGEDSSGQQEEEDLLFTTPFEINSTQVQFVANTAEFIDKEAAKAAVQPVAEALSAHPDHSVLISGTTAALGSQEGCVELSNSRAEAVKNLLVDEFNIPASQIETIGLGYEADPFERGQDHAVAGDINSAFIESEAKKNRRVVIVDIEDPIAQQILANN